MLTAKHATNLLDLFTVIVLYADLSKATMDNHQPTDHHYESTSKPLHTL